ncbi:MULTISPECIES: alpha/beta fold hydrolase [Methylomonas]|uniref:alpha/beta fold hydrolase n=1 Tax=Methylomonas TaxID=416 RepID=UPI001232E81F|nr:alpha/beta hydrolase [Methylomonas rhizoryzae]
MTTLVLLPGMDGTGILFEFLLPHLPPGIVPKVVSYPARESLSYDELTNFVLGQLPDPPFAILGESFSGPVAVAVAARSAPLAVVLVCSFIGNPRPMLTPLKALLGWLPSPAMLVGPLSLALMGWNQTPNLRAALSCSLETVEPVVLRHRAAAALSANARPSLALLRCPILYLQATHDRVVPSSCAREVLRVQPATTVAKLEGPHFLLQTRPAAAAQAIEQFLRRSENVDRDSLSTYSDVLFY